MVLEQNAVIATHHKTGTVWMRTVFTKIANHFGLPFLNLKRKNLRILDSIVQPSIILNNHSDFSYCSWVLQDENYKIFHIIRDPRDVIISAMKYHLSSSETWLHKPKKVLGHMSYQEKLNSIPTDYLRYIFEMEHSSYNIITAMRDWNYNLPYSIEYKYEDLMADENMIIFSKIIKHLGFSEEELIECNRLFWESSIFGGLNTQGSQHIRSGRRRQWVSVFDNVLAEAFLERFGDVLIQLGYETDNSWANRG